MFFIWLLVFVVIVVFILALPYVSGIASYDVERKKKPVQKKSAVEPSRSMGAPVGYVPPSFEVKDDAEEAASTSGISALKDKMRLTSEDIPLKLHLNDSSSLRRRKTDKIDMDSNPNNYDYDLDELIEEEWDEKKQQSQPQVSSKVKSRPVATNEEVRELV
ncbi:uncharacterized protein KQ657_002970 [Scheffersomyces spartinae]|uniref:Uncharacterized protein n=1 Tax=Scheffersomyces spartinae TaxID=45513 RepID=A0A9P8AGY7_9ASCO|nr:uncharacterized protein KQ657_002970 [Scheffersomyces spartinae]KAG7191577.1 hypothetical protein KQ657_002970 [Scheffersomyces spartinae]